MCRVRAIKIGAILILLLLLLAAACHAGYKKPLTGTGPQPHCDTLAAMLKERIPVMGRRYVVTGDFDGDGRGDTLTEHYTDSCTNGEAAKYFEGYEDDWEGLFAISGMRWAESFACCSNQSIDTLHFSQGRQMTGLAWLKNEGDLNGDGGDEVSYVIENVDNSAVNSCLIVSWQGRGWKELCSFSIHESELDDRAWLVKKVRPGIIDVWGLNKDFSPDTMRIDLKNQKPQIR